MSSSTTNGKNASIATAIAAVPSTNANPTNEATVADPTLAQQEHDFFNQIPNEKEKAKLTKDSILALYGAAPSMNALPTNNQFMPGMPSMNVDNGSLFGMQIPSYQSQQQPAFGMPAVNQQNAGAINNFAQFGLMQQGQQMNFPQSPHTINSMPNQSMGFSNVPQNSSLQNFNQTNVTKTNSFPTAALAPNANNVNQQFGNLNLGNVWQ